ncbi:hypothetical protein J2754_002152 [Halarchaeum solikamskense]|nr:hypothetical protein [Halarchaeum solikamskense]
MSAGHRDETRGFIDLDRRLGKGLVFGEVVRDGLDALGELTAAEDVNAGSRRRDIGVGFGVSKMIVDEGVDFTRVGIADVVVVDDDEVGLEVVAVGNDVRRLVMGKFICPFCCGLEVRPDDWVLRGDVPIWLIRVVIGCAGDLAAVVGFLPGQPS